MATATTAPRSHDRGQKRYPFAWMRRLANLTGGPRPTKGKPNGIKNNPYPESGFLQRHSIASSANGQLSYSTPIAGDQHSFISHEEAGHSGHAPAKSTRSAAPTVATNPETIQSDTAKSRAETNHTAGGTIVSSNDGAGNSPFSSPNHSEHSLTTTLTTIQSTNASHLLQPAVGTPTASQATTPTGPNTNVQFYNTPPPSAIPPHLAPQGHPSTFAQATANNLLTDNASILTLASSSKRRRRHSLDTDASVRALAPSSVWGGSRESLPLSVLSGNVDNTSLREVQTPHAPRDSRPSIGGGLASAERVSVYSSSGVAAPALSSERNSFYAEKQRERADGASVRSGLLGHGRQDSITGSIGGSGAGTASTPVTATTATMGGQGMGSALTSPVERVTEPVKEDADDDVDSGHGVPHEEQSHEHASE